FEFVPLPRSMGSSPVPRQRAFALGITLSVRLWFPAAFRPTAFASGDVLCPLGDRPPLRSAHCLVGRAQRGCHVPHGGDGHAPREWGQAWTLAWRLIASLTRATSCRT